MNEPVHRLKQAAGASARARAKVFYATLGLARERGHDARFAPNFTVLNLPTLLDRGHSQSHIYKINVHTPMCIDIINWRIK